LKDGKAVAVSDFFMSKIKDTRTSRTGYNEDNDPIKWMAPESITNSTYSPKSDSFSYGYVLYEIITRKTPWSGVSAEEVSKQVTSGNRPQIPHEPHHHHKNNKYPQVLATVMEMCWKQNPDERPNFKQILQVLNGGQ